MKREKYKELVDVHMQNQIWRNELEMALLEIDFWEDLLEVQEVSSPPLTGLVDRMSQLHHYQRLAQYLLVEVLQQEHEVAGGVQKKRILATPSPTDRHYLRQQMDTFHLDFQGFKTDIRQFIAAQTLG